MYTHTHTHTDTRLSSPKGVTHSLPRGPSAALDTEPPPPILPRGLLGAHPLPVPPQALGPHPIGWPGPPLLSRRNRKQTTKQTEKRSKVPGGGVLPPQSR